MKSYPLTTAKANRLARTFLVITRHLRGVQTLYGFSKSSSSDSKKNFSVLGLGFPWGGVTSGVVFAVLWPTLPGPGRLSNGPTFWPKYLLCHKKQKVVKNPTPKKGNQGGITSLLDMAITSC